MSHQRVLVLAAVFATVLAGLAAAACGKEGAAAAQAAVESERGIVSGRLTTEDGRPIRVAGAAATVAIEGVAAKSGERVQYAAGVQPDGTYRQKVVDGSYRVQRASVVLDHDGDTWTFHDVEPAPLVRGDRSAEAGITQDFVWRVRGKRPGTSGDVNNQTHWYGGNVSARWAGYREDVKKAQAAPPAGTKFVFTLTPRSTRVDGAPAETIVQERPWDPSRGIDALNDIPRARYDLTGVAVLPGGKSEPLVFEVAYAKYAASAPVEWKPGMIGGPILGVGFSDVR